MMLFFSKINIFQKKGSRGEFVPHTDGAFITYNYRLKKRNSLVGGHTPQNLFT